MFTGPAPSTANQFTPIHHDDRVYHSQSLQGTHMQSHHSMQGNQPVSQALQGNQSADDGHGESDDRNLFSAIKASFDMYP